MAVSCECLSQKNPDGCSQPQLCIRLTQKSFFFLKIGPHVVLPGLNKIGSQGHAICLSAQHTQTSDPSAFNFSALG